MSEPTTLPRWADGLSAEIVEPSSGRKDLGWETSQRPPPQYFNWYKNLVYQWIKYLSGPTKAQEQLAFATMRPWTVDSFTSDLRAVACQINSTNPADVNTVAVGLSGGIIAAFNADDKFAQQTPGSSYSGDFKGVAFNSLGFAAVGTGKEIQTSPTGSVWTRRVTGSGTFNAVCGNGSTFVAVGDAALIYQSTALSTWTSRAGAIASKNITDICFGAGLFVAVGEDASIQTSTDGITWVQRTSPSLGATIDYLWVRYDATRGFVAVFNSGSSYNIVTSPDGITWTGTGAGFTSNNIDTVTLTENGLYAAQGTVNGSYLSATYDNETTNHVQPFVSPFRIRAFFRTTDRAFFAVGDGGKVLVSPRIPGAV